MCEECKTVKEYDRRHKPEGTGVSTDWDHPFKMPMHRWILDRGRQAFIKKLEDNK